MSRGAKKEKSLTDVLGAFLAKQLLPDLRACAKAANVEAALRHRWEHERAEERTAEAFEPWVDQTVEQVGAAWILSCVFVRTLEDRGLLPRRRLAGEGAEDSEHYFYELAPSLNARDYLLTVFREVSRFPGAEELLGPKSNPAWRLGPSAPIAQALLAELRELTAEKKLKWDFSGADTRFLGDLYQDLSASVRERYALLQTPEFVERFILKLTLDPAIEEFGLEEVRLIDPTCGSGHFLLGAYDKLFEARTAAKPGVDRRQHALDALAQVYGVDINPYAVAIARFRLTLSYLEKAGIEKLAQAPKLPLNLVVADSLLYGARGVTMELSERATSKKEWGDALFTLEEPDRALEVLSRGYHAVVGNPPYITCKDAKLRDRYRRLYVACHREYALAAPFTERFFQLAVASGFVGMINANSFMKREFGKKLIEQVLSKLDLTDVIDTSGAYIPGHGTPTVILAGRNRAPEGDNVAAVLGKRGEPQTPDDPEQGKVWSTISGHARDIGVENEYVSVACLERSTLAKHPWSLGGGGAAELKDHLETRAKKRLCDLVDVIGFGAITREDEVFEIPLGGASRWALPNEAVAEYGYGEAIRDWACTHDRDVLFPYSQAGTLPLEKLGWYGKLTWLYRAQLWGRVGKGFKTKRDSGGEYYEYSMFYPDRHFTPFKITFAFVATHNHFVLDRGGKVFNRSAPIIKLPEGATEEDHLALLGYLNSSTACFWMKQTFFDKGNRGEGGGVTAEKWEKFFEFDGTKLQALPIFEVSPRARQLSKLLDEAGRRWQTTAPECVLTPDVEPGVVLVELDTARRERDLLEGQIRWLQEELDWEIYATCGLPNVRARQVPDSLGHVPVRPKGTRPSDRLYAKQVQDGTETPRFFHLAGMPTAEEILRLAVDPLDEQRLALISGSHELQLIEVPAYKRTYREGHRAWDAVPAIHEWARARVEAIVSVRPPTAGPSSLKSLVNEAMRDFNPLLVGIISGADLSGLDELVPGAAVPYLAPLRLTDAGQAKRAHWEHTWDLQRREDAGEKVEIPVPPKYDQKDYRDPIYWRLRGKLDVPKERFISYPGAERDDDKSPLIGWAGWDHLQRAQALAALYQERKNQDGWEKERLMPLLAGLLELVPWLKQWHNEPSEDPAKDRAGDAYAAFVETEALGFGWTLADLRGWRPEERRRGRRRGTARPSTGSGRAGKRDAAGSGASLGLRQAQAERGSIEDGGDDGALVSPVSLSKAQGERGVGRSGAKKGKAVLKTDCPGESPAPKPRKPRRKKAKSEETAE